MDCPPIPIFVYLKILNVGLISNIMFQTKFRVYLSQVKETIYPTTTYTPTYKLHFYFYNCMFHLVLKYWPAVELRTVLSEEPIVMNVHQVSFLALWAALQRLEEHLDLHLSFQLSCRCPEARLQGHKQAESTAHQPPHLDAAVHSWHNEGLAGGGGRGGEALMLQLPLVGIFLPALWLSGKDDAIPNYAFISRGGGHRLCEVMTCWSSGGVFKAPSSIPPWLAGKGKQLIFLIPGFKIVR